MYAAQSFPASSRSRLLSMLYRRYMIISLVADQLLRGVRPDAGPIVIPYRRLPGTTRYERLNTTEAK